MLKEIWEELQEFAFSKQGIVDAFVPVIVFLIVEALGGGLISAAAGLGISIMFLLYRILKGQEYKLAVVGFISIVVAAGLVYLTGRSEAFFTTDIIQNAAMGLIAVLTVIIRRPLVAWTSFLARRWPLDWYWHPKVVPAYSEVTMFWGFYFIVEGALKWQIFQEGDATKLGLINILTGIPALVALLVLSYAYGLWRLRNLKGPSVEEFIKKKKSPWKGQRRGF